MAGGDAQAQVEALLESFRAPDAIMETDILARLRKYIAAKGSPQAAVAALSSSYEGHAEVCNTLLEWMGLVGVSEPERDALVVGHVKECVVAKYDPKLTRALFESATETPGWVMFMIGSPVWRELFYHLSESYAECLLVNFAIRSISESDDVAHELASLKKSAANTFGVFSQILSAQLETLLSSPDPLLDPVFGEFVALTTQSENTFLFASTLLNGLAAAASEPAVSALLLRLDQELLAAVPPARAPMFRKFAVRVSGLMQYPALASAIMSIFKSETPATTPGDIIRIFKVYGGANPPPLSLISDPVLIDLLVDDLFAPTRVVAAKHRTKYLSVLALIAAGVDTRPRAADGARVEGPIDKTEVPRVLGALRTIHHITLKKPFGPGLAAVYRDLLAAVAVAPICGLAVIAYARAALSASDFFATNKADANIYLSLINGVGSTHPVLAPRILDALAHLLALPLFASETSADSLGFPTKVMDCISFVLLLGEAKSVLALIRKWAASGAVDKSVVRHFVLNVIQIVSPPLEPAFASELAQVMVDNDFAEFVETSLSATDTLTLSGLTHLKPASEAGASGGAKLAGLRTSAEALLSAELIDALVVLVAGIAEVTQLDEPRRALVDTLFGIDLLAERAADLGVELRFFGEARALRVKVSSHV